MKSYLVGRLIVSKFSPSSKRALFASEITRQTPHPTDRNAECHLHMGSHFLGPTKSITMSSPSIRQSNNALHEGSVIKKKVWLVYKDSRRNISSDSFRPTLGEIKKTKANKQQRYTRLDGFMGHGDHFFFICSHKLIRCQTALPAQCDL